MDAIENTVVTINGKWAKIRDIVNASFISLFHRNGIDICGDVLDMKAIKKQVSRKHLTLARAENGRGSSYLLYKNGRLIDGFEFVYSTIMRGRLGFYICIAVKRIFVRRKPTMAEWHWLKERGQEA